MSEQPPVDPSSSPNGESSVRLRRKDEARDSAEQAAPAAPEAATTEEAPVANAANAADAAETADGEGAPVEASDAAGDASPIPRRRVFDPTAERDQEASAGPPAKKRKRSRGSRGRKRGKGGGGGGQGSVTTAGDAPAVTREDFEAMLAADGRDGAATNLLEPGQVVIGVLVKLGEEVAFVDLGGKTEAYIPTSELLDKEGALTVELGAEIKARVVRYESGGQIRLGRKAQKGGSSVEVEDAFNAGVPVSGLVKAVNKGGFEVEALGQRAFCPISHIDLAFTEDPSVHVGATYEFKIIEYGENGRRFVVSRSALLKEERAERAREVRAKLEVGVILEGTVRSLQDYGAFIDLGGIDGLVHVSEIAHHRINHANEVLSVGETVSVKVLKIEPGKKGERIGLSIKQAGADPWEGVEDWLTPGARLQGTVARLAQFGAFVELKPGIEGLIHISEMSWERRVRHPSDVVKVGDTVEVAVVDFNPHNKRIGLSLKATKGDPWEGSADRFQPGQEVTGTVESLADFGVFLKVAPGIVGLIPLRELGTRPGTPPSRDFTIGQELTVKVLSVEEDRRRMSLTRREDAEFSREGQGVQRRRGGGGDRDDRGRGRNDRRGGGRGRGGGGGRDSGRGQTYQEAGGSFATLADLLAPTNDRKNR